MALAWNPWALVGLLPLAAAWAMAAVVWRTAPGQPVNRRLTLLLALEGLDVATSPVGAAALAASAGSVQAFAAAHYAVDAALPFAYLLFLGAALDAPLARPFRGPRAQRALLGLALAAPVAALAAGPLLAGPGYLNPDPATAAAVPWLSAQGPWLPWLLAALGATFLLGLAAAVQAWRSAATPLARRRARGFAAAFGAKDAVWGGAFLLTALAASGAAVPGGALLLAGQLYALVAVAYVGLLGYAILRTQLFDIEVKVKRGLERSLVAGLFAALFFVASELLEGLVPVEDTVLGLAAAALVTLGLKPIEAAAARGAERLMPGVGLGEPYLRTRRAEVYGAAVESALEVGGIDARERLVLDRLRGKLGLPAEEAARVEAEVRARVPPGGAPKMPAPA